MGHQEIPTKSLALVRTPEEGSQIPYYTENTTILVHLLKNSE